MRVISITGGSVMVDDEDYDRVISIHWVSSNGYARQTGTDKRKNIMMHRMILGAQSGQQIDHVDGNRLNNQKSNLRFSTQSQNMWNRRVSKLSTCGLKGVIYDKHCRLKWRAAIRMYGKRQYLGMFQTPELAHAAYCEAAKKYFGEFANDGTGPIIDTERRTR